MSDALKDVVAWLERTLDAVQADEDAPFEALADERRVLYASLERSVGALESTPESRELARRLRALEASLASLLASESSRVREELVQHRARKRVARAYGR